MAPVIPLNSKPSFGVLARRALAATGPVLVKPSLDHLSRRGLSVNHTQGVTLGVIAAYVVIIALLWNIPYVKYVLWPFKVSRLARLEIDPRIVT